MSDPRPRSFRLERLEDRRVLTAPTITSFVVQPSTAATGERLEMLVEANDAENDLRDVSFYRDDGDGQLGASDTWLGTDSDGSDGWQWFQTTASPYRILPLGDSITQPEWTQQSYRYPLWQNLLDAQYAFDFVGSQTENHGGSSSWPDYLGQSFDQDHEGHYGFRADQILSNLPTWLVGNTPDVVLMHVGTNDLFQAESISSTLDELEQIVTELRISNPNVVVLASLLIPTEFPSNQLIDDFNAQLPGRVAQWSTAESPVILVDQNSQIDPSLHLYDGVHPNSLGEQIMADVWEDAITSVLPVADPATTFQVGTHTFFAVATDQLDESSSAASATVDLQDPDSNNSTALSESEDSVYGAIMGDHRLTHQSDDQYQQITEITVGNRRQAIHNWQFTVPAGRQATVEIEAFHNSPDERFYVNYSANGSSWRNILSVTKRVDDNQIQTAQLPSDLSGDVWIRIKDSKPQQDATNDTVFIDYLGIRLEGDPGPILPEVQVVTESHPSEAGLAPGSMTVTRTGSTDDPLTVSYSVSGTATAGADYTALTGTVMIPAGSQQAAIDIQPLDDLETEGNETIIVTLVPNVEYALGDSLQAIATLADNDQPDGVLQFFPVVESTVSGTASNLGNVFESDDQYQQLTEADSPNDVLWHTWEFDVTAGTSPKVVLEAHSSSSSERFYINYSTGQSFQNIFSVSAASDQTYEYPLPENTSGRVYLKVRDSNSSEGVADSLLVDRVFIEAIQPVTTPTLILTTDVQTVSEGDGTAAATATVTRQNADQSNALTVTLVSDDTTELAVPAEVSIPANASSVTFDIDAIDDIDVDGSQVATITASAENFISGIAAVSVLDDETPGVIQMVEGAYSVNESQGTVRIELARVGGSGGVVSVDYSTSDGTAFSPDDYTAASGSVSFLDGQTSAFMDVAITEDSVAESSESFTVSLDAVTGGATLGNPQSSVVTIADDDQPSGVFRFFPVQESTVLGAASGSNNLLQSDNQYQQLTETAAPDDRLWHTWEFDVAAGANPKLVLEARSTTSFERFYVNFATESMGFLNILSVSSTNDQTYEYALPEYATGRVYVKARDSNGTEGSMDALLVDQIYIETVDDSQPPPPESEPVSFPFFTPDGTSTKFSQELGEDAFDTAHLAIPGAIDSPFPLAARNVYPTGMTSDGQHVWIVDACVREVFKYTSDGQLVGNWSLDSRNGNSRGITHHPDGFEFGLWVLDASNEQIFAYPNGTTHIEGRHRAAMTHAWTDDSAAEQAAFADVDHLMAALAQEAARESSKGLLQDWR